MESRFARIAAAAALLAGALLALTLSAPAQDGAGTGTRITGASTGAYPGLSALESQNLNTALEFMESMGNQAEADSIRALAKAGDISAEKLGSGESGETSAVTGHITINTTTITPFTRLTNQPPLDGDNSGHISEIARLASTLIHEFTHSGQSYGEWVTSKWAETAGSGNASELEAWSAGLSALESWIQSFRNDLREAQERGAHPDEIARLARAVRDLAGLYQSLRIDFETLKYGTMHWRADDGTFLGFNATYRMLVGLIDDMETIIAGASGPASNLADDIADAIGELKGAAAATAASTGQGIDIRPELNPMEAGEQQGLDEGVQAQGVQPNVTAPGLTLTIEAGPPSQ